MKTAGYKCSSDGIRTVRRTALTAVDQVWLKRSSLMSDARMPPRRWNNYAVCKIYVLQNKKGNHRQKIEETRSLLEETRRRLVET